MSCEPVIELEGLTKRYPRITAVNQLSLEIQGGRITAFLGRNGAGKSTTIKMLLGMTRPTAGTGAVLSKSINEVSQNRDARRAIGYVAEDKTVYGYMTVQQVIRFARSFFGDWDLEWERQLIKLFEIPEKARVSSLSKGMRTKLALLLALARRAKLLILDEPTEGLDPISLEQILQELVARVATGTTVFYSSHMISEVERVADDICIIDKGTVVANFSMETMQRDYRHITIGLPFEPNPSQFSFPGVERIRIDGRQVTMLARHDVDAIVALSREMKPLSLDVTPASLREVFLETVKED